MPLKKFKLIIKITICLIVFSSRVYSQVENLYGNNYNSFADGEILEYKLKYGFFNTSYASLSLNEINQNGKKIYKASAIGRTTGMARLFFKVEDLYESYFEKDFVRPIKSVRDIYEGGYIRNSETTFDHTNNIGYFKNILNGKEKEIKLLDNIQDLVSTFYFLRKHLDISKLKPNDYIFVNIFFSAENYPFKMKYLGKEILKTKFGLVECMKFIPFMESGRVFRDNEGISLWVTIDENRIPNISISDSDKEKFKNIGVSIRHKKKRNFSPILPNRINLE